MTATDKAALVLVLSLAVGVIGIAYSEVVMPQLAAIVSALSSSRS